jgi:antitoxin HigA-1
VVETTGYNGTKSAFADWRAQARALRVRQRVFRMQTGPTMIRIPENRVPTHPGEVLTTELLEPLGISPARLAAEIHLPARRVRLIARGERPVKADVAVRLARFFDTSAAFWLQLQQRWDLHQALRSPRATEIEAIQPLHPDLPAFDDLGPVPDHEATT